MIRINFPKVAHTGGRYTPAIPYILVRTRNLNIWTKVVSVQSLLRLSWGFNCVEGGNNKKYINYNVAQLLLFFLYV